jgi:hypothetical protein
MNRCDKVVKEKLVKNGTQKLSHEKKAAYLEKLGISRQQKKVPISVQMCLSLERQDH